MKQSYLLALFFLVSVVYGKKISYQEAENIALKWISKQTKLSKKVAPDIAYGSYKHNMRLVSDSKKPYYIFNLEGGGWIIVADDDINSKILAYSEKSSLDPNNLPPQFKWWLDGVSKELNSAKRVAKSKRVYRSLSSKPQMAYATVPNAKDSVGPLLKSNWGQGRGYNEYCPKDSRSIEGNGHVPAGCVAVAMAQIMNYYAWPPKGWGANSYIPPSNPQYGRQSVNFADTSYNWSNSSASKVIYHAGVSVNMDYGPYGSGAYITNAQNALRGNFGYSTSSVTAKYSDSQWDSMLINSLNQNRLVLYQGKGEIVHVFVCDGYKKVEDGYMYHFNWGWGGRANGWFRIGAMTPFGNRSFNRSNYAIFDIYPSDPSYNLDVKRARASINIYVAFLFIFILLAPIYRGFRE